MDRGAYLAALERDGLAFLESIERAPDGARVASCPEWSVDDLLWHLTEVHWFWRRIVELRAQDWKEVGELERSSIVDMRAEYASGLDALLEALRSTPPETAIWTWSEQKDVAFVVRRMAQETAVHRWDADDAARGGGDEPRIEPELASDGVDEFLEHFLTPRDDAPMPGSVHLHCTDVAGEWLVVPDPENLYAMTREHAKGDAAIRGAASDLLLVLWRRIPLTRVDVVGNADIARRFVELSRLD
jgi:uncharacterized protein (TIGR03083 family)